MDNSQFLSHFWGLSEKKSKETMVDSAQAVVNLIESKQKLEKSDSTTLDKTKYNLYLNTCMNPCEELLYTLRRLIGGVCSTGTEWRKGFLLTFSFLLRKFQPIINFPELALAISKESNVSKSEKKFIRNCAVTGKVSLLKCCLDEANIPHDALLYITKSLIAIISKEKITEEAILYLFDVLLGRIKSDNFYTEISNTKKTKKVLEKLFDAIDSAISGNKSAPEKIKHLYKIGLMFILLKHSEKETNLNKNIFEEEFLQNYFKLILSNTIRDNEFHYSFKLFISLISEFKEIVRVWNFVIDPNSQSEFRSISQKNTQLLLFNLAKIFLDKFFMLKYIMQIFDHTFWQNMMKFSSGKKFKYINSLLNVLSEKLKTADEDIQIKSEYCLDLLKMFGNDPTSNLSVQTSKNLYVGLFNSLNEEHKKNFVQTLVSEDTEDVEDYLFQIVALKQLMITTEADIPEEQTNAILEFFFRQYYKFNNQFEEEVEDIIEDRTFLIIFSYSKPKPEVTKMAEEDNKPTKDLNVIKNLAKVNKILQSLYKKKVLDAIDVEDYKVYLKFYKQFQTLLKGKEVENKDELKKLYAVLKLAYMCSLLFLKHPGEYFDILSDLLEISKFSEGWEKVYTDLMISLLHKGGNTLVEFVMNTFKKTSKFLDKSSIEVLISFISDKEEPAEEDDEFEVIENGQANGNGLHEEDVEMQSLSDK